jgi:hypothetical protein
MSPIKHILLSLLIIYSWSCANNPTERHQSNRNNVVNVHDKVKEIPMEEPPISNINFIYLMADYLMISDYKSPSELLHLFDRKTFNHVGSFIPRGQGPGEIARIGHIGVDEARRKFYVSDHGKQKVFSYYLDSLLANPDYMPEEKTTMGQVFFPDKYYYISDTLCIGVIIERFGNSRFNQSVARWNMNTGEFTPLKYERLDDIKNRRLSFAVSTEHGLIAKSYHHYDLMTICTLDGDLKYNIYGSGWKRSEGSNRTTFYHQPAFCDDRIFVLYLGENTYSDDRQHVVYPTKLQVFDLDGNYLKTLETGYNIISILYDRENNRLIMNMDDDVQFGYLNLDGLVE